MLELRHEDAVAQAFHPQSDAQGSKSPSARNLILPVNAALSHHRLELLKLVKISKSNAHDAV